MKIVVETVGYMTSALGARAVSLSLPPGSTVADAIRAVLGPDGQAGGVVLKGGDEITGCLLMLNGLSLKLQSDLKRPVSDGDRLTIVPPLAGGGTW